MTIAFGCDHAALQLKQEIMEFAKSLGHSPKDYGTFTEERADYPEYAKKVANAVADGECDLGILVCGTGVGMSIAANKVKGIRAVVCSEPFSAKLSREHNDTNILCLGARVIGSEFAKMIVEIWLSSKFQEGRHISRVKMFE
ncbi:MAG: ribose 5-phosphate isomerase B [Defluviitaleaceae bacterium]|nr:ribose 5-phosphate isomerase B [Defluviitaleaceae bacterium]